MYQAGADNGVLLSGNRVAPSGVPSGGLSSEVESSVGESVVTRRGRAPGDDGHADQWYRLAGELALGGVAKMIAENAVLSELLPGRVSLLLDRAHDTLLSDSQVRIIERALSERLGEDIRLSVEVGEVSVETPARRHARIDAERQRDAQELLESDVTVKSLLSEFGGRLDEVRPVDRPDGQSGGVIR